MAATRRRKKEPQTKWQNLVRRVNVLFRRANRREVLTFLLSVVIAAFFWTVQTSREESEQEFVVDLLIEDQPQYMVFTTRVPTQLRVTLTDTNARLFNYRLTGAMTQIEVDFERYADAIGNFRISAAELQSLLRADLKGSTQITAVSPSLIDARFAHTEGRKYPVRLRTKYYVTDNYRLRPVVIDPDSVTINAPTSVLDTLQWVWTVASTVQTPLRDTLEEQLPLDLPIGVKATPGKIRVVAPVAQYVEKVFEGIEVQVTDVPDDRQLIVFPYSARVSCLVDFDRYRHLQPEDFEVSVSYDSIVPGDPDHRLPISVRYLGTDSETVTNIAIQPSQAEYLVEPRPVTPNAKP